MKELGERAQDSEDNLQLGACPPAKADPHVKVDLPRRFGTVGKSEIDVEFERSYCHHEGGGEQSSRIKVPSFGDLGPAAMQISASYSMSSLGMRSRVRIIG